jgi:hypothetical protein
VGPLGRGVIGRLEPTGSGASTVRDIAPVRDTAPSPIAPAAFPIDPAATDPVTGAMRRPHCEQ